MPYSRGVRWLVAAACAIASAATLACRGGDSPRPDASEPFEGGELALSSCGYSVRTGVGATAPALAGQRPGDDPTPRHVHLGLAGPPATSMVVTWRTQDGVSEGGAVRFGADSLGRTEPAITWQYKDGDGDVFRIHEAHLCGLDPDTTYRYVVDSGATSSPELGFRTAPDPAAQPDAEVVILALGDSRGGAQVLGELLAAADELATPDLLLFTGDAVTYGANHAQWEAFFDEAGAVLQRVPTIITVGNHEQGDIAYFSLWALPGDERFFSLDYRAAHIAVADDSSTLYPDQNGDGEAFLASDLAAVPGGLHTIVMHHQPLFSAQSPDGHGPTERLRERWMPIFDQHRVELVLAGHDHKYERTLPIRDGTVAAGGDGTTYVVTGAAGAPLYEAPTDAFTAVAISVAHFVVLRVRSAQIALSTYDGADTLLDSLTLPAAAP